MNAGQICRYVAALLFLGLGAQGVWGGYGQLGDAETLGQDVQSAMQFAFGALGLAAGAFLVLRRSVPLAIEWGWTIALALAGGIAAVAWGETSILIGIVGGIASGLVGLAVVWLGRRGTAQESVVEIKARESW